MMMSFRSTRLSLLSVVLMALACRLVSVQAFAPSISRTASASSSQQLFMAPRYDTSAQRWIPSTEDESADAGYPPIRSLLRHGPKAFLVRLTQADNYDQAVLKFMAQEKCDRWNAMGNMDRYFENGADWAYERYEMERTGKTYDYVTLDSKQVVLSSVWACVVVWFAYDIVQRYVLHP